MPVYIPANRLTLSDALDRFCTEVLKRDYYQVPETELRTSAAPIRQLLASGRLHAWSLDGHTGKQTEIPVYSWNGSQLWTVAVRDAYEGGIIVVSRDEFERHASVESDGESTPVQAFPHSEYVPPYIEYMLGLAYRLDLTPDYNFNRKAMVAFIMEDAPKELRGKEKARYMATFLGNPDYESGGSPKTEQPDQSERSTDPLKTFRGVRYPKPLNSV